MILRYGNFVIGQTEYIYGLIPIIIFLIILLRKNYVKQEQRLFTTPGKKRFMFFMRVLIFSLLIISLSNPHLEYKQSLTNVTKVKVLIDKSNSMVLYDLEEVDSLINSFNNAGISTEIKQLNMGDYTSLGNEILNNIAPNENLLLISDGQNNFGPSLEDVSLFAASINSKIYGLELEQEVDDARVVIEGPSKVVSGVENEFTISVKVVGSVGKKIINVFIDDKSVYSGSYLQEINLKRDFASGYHVIKAELETNDHFKQNNIYYKTITVYDKPKILFITRTSSTLEELYSPFYDIDKDDDLSKNLDPYYAVVINNIDSKYIEEEFDKLEAYVEEGNGLFVVGGKNSYDWSDYNTSVISNILPVSIGKANKKQDITNIVIVMDTGASSGEALTEEVSKFDVQKSLAVDILKSISSTNKVAFIEGNYYLNTLSQLSELGPKRSNLIGQISLLKPQGFSELRFAYEKAHQILRLNKGSKYIVIITDGKLIPQDQAVTLEYVEQAFNDGIKTFIIGVGGSADDAFLEDVKEKGGGEYFKANEKHKIKIYFGDPDQGGLEDLELFVYDSNHFITNELKDLGNIYGFNSVYPKSTARLLLTTSSGDPVLTIWNYGLGRVASLSTDDGSSWVPDLMKGKNSAVLIRTLNWLIEDPERKSDSVINMPPLRVGENSVITLRSDDYPQSSLNFYEISNNIYQANFYPNQTGIANIVGSPAAVNYKKEYLNLGINSNLKKVLGISGGELLSLEGDITERLKSLTEVETTKKLSLSWLFISVGITLYLIELIVRRIIEMKEMK